jgi:hypothetical protein
VNPLNVAVSRAAGHDGYFTEETVLARVPDVLRLLACLFGLMLAVGGTLLLRFADDVVGRSADGSGHDDDDRDRIGSTAGRALCRVSSPSSPLPSPTTTSCSSANGGVGPLSAPPATTATTTTWKGPSKTPKKEAIIEKEREENCWWEPVAAVLRRPELYYLWMTRFGVVLVNQVLSGLSKAFALDQLDYSDEFVSSVGAAAGLFNCAGRVIFGFAVDNVAYK